MFRYCVLSFAALFAILWHSPAKASGDYGCTTHWKLTHSQLTGCDNMALLGPGNDTRVNILLLLRDRHGDKSPPVPAAPPLAEWRSMALGIEPVAQAEADVNYSEGEGSRCRSNESGTAAFEAAMNMAKKLPATERAALLAARRGLVLNCFGRSEAAPGFAELGSVVKSAPGKAFLTYLQGARAFYDADFDYAAADFAELSKSEQPWLKETARYMLARVEINRAQVGAFDEYGDFAGPKNVNSAASAKAEALLRGYIRDYPQGLYTGSARGLIRRVYWLAGQTDKLVSEYRALLAAPAGGVHSITDSDLAQEMDNKLLPLLTPANAGDPAFLAVIDLLRMRGGPDQFGETSTETPVSRAELEAQRGAFAKDPALFEYLLAAHAWYVAKTPAEVLKLIPDAARQPAYSYVQFSRQMLRGMALEATKDRNARGFWLEMMKGANAPYQSEALQLALAMHDERNGALSKIFEPGSPVRGGEMREILLMSAANAPLLRQQAKDAQAPAHERDIALFTLLYKQLTRGAYRDFVSDLALVKPGALSEPSYGILSAEAVPVGMFTSKANTGDYDCPALKDTAARLVAAPSNPTARLCLADFMRVNGFDGFTLDTLLPNDELGGSTSLFPGGSFSRLEIYKAVIADPAAGAPDKAYALYRAVQCYAPGGTNSCGGVEVPVSQRKAWFLRLKKDYPTSRWATQSRYFW